METLLPFCLRKKISVGLAYPKGAAGWHPVPAYVVRDSEKRILEVRPPGGDRKRAVARLDLRHFKLREDERQIVSVRLNSDFVEISLQR